jgi:sensor histidine kinase YesM
MSRRSLIIGSLLVWLLLCSSHTILFVFAYNIPLNLAIGDSLITNTFLFLSGLGLYLMIQFEGRKTSGISHFLRLIFGYFVAISLFYITSDPILSTIAEGKGDYAVLFEDSRIPRVIIVAILLLLVLIMLRLYHNMQSLREKTEQSLRLQSMLKESELQALRWQINPHFLFNSLNSISSLTMSDAEKARNMIIKLSELLRYSLKKDMDAMTTLQSELQHLKLYTDIEQIRFGERLHFDSITPDECMDAKLPFLILQPLIENAIKHGVYSTERDCTVQLRTQCSSNLLEVFVENSYDAEGRNTSGTNTGIANTKERMKLIYSDESLCKFRDNGENYLVHLRFPQL